MVPEEKPDFPPLLAAGIHAHTLSELEAVALAPFGGPGLERRIELFSRLKYWIGQLSTVGLSMDVWIDGSFMTHCPMPRDIDLLVVAPENDVNNLPHDVRPTLEQLTNNQFCKRRQYHGSDFHPFFHFLFLPRVASVNDSKSTQTNTPKKFTIWC